MRHTVRSLSLFVGFASATAGLSRVALADPFGTNRPPEIAEAVEEFEAARKEIHLDLFKSFDVVANRLTSQDLPLEVRVKLKEIIADEKIRFGSQGLLPWSQPMWPSIATYQKNIGLAETRLRRIYVQAITRAVRANATDEVDRLRDDLEAVLRPRVVATWWHRFGRGPRKVSFYSNGRIGAPDGKATWVFHNGTLTMVWLDPRAPRGVWKDVCTVSADGSTYAGKNQRKNPIGGHYVAE